MIRISFVLFSTFALAIAACGSSAPAPDAPSSGGEAKGYGYEFEVDSAKDPKPAKTSAPGDIKAGRLPPEIIQGIVRENFGKFKECYEAGLKKDPKLEGDIKVRFVIKEDGTTTDAKDEGSTLADKDVVTCVVSAFAPITYPKPEGGIVTVVYPIKFSP